MAGTSPKLEMGLVARLRRLTTFLDPDGVTVEGEYLPSMDRERRLEGLGD